MPSPFPGMNPYLEHPALWPGVHHWLITELARALTPQLRPSYYIAVTVPMPETVHEGYLEVRRVVDHAVITTIEVLSAKNKRPGKGREQYEAKRLAVIGSRTHLVEIDLLRIGEPLPVLGVDRQSHYRILVSRSYQRPTADLYAFNVQSAIPTFALPLQAGDEEPMVDLNALINRIYDEGGYDLRLDYHQPPVPDFEGDAAIWLDRWRQENDSPH
jgi:hypothetical protein